MVGVAKRSAVFLHVYVIAAQSHDELMLHSQATSRQGTMELNIVKGASSAYPLDSDPLLQDASSPSTSPKSVAAPAAPAHVHRITDTIDN